MRNFFSICHSRVLLHQQTQEKHTHKKLYWQMQNGVDSCRKRAIEEEAHDK